MNEPTLHARFVAAVIFATLLAACGKSTSPSAAGHRSVFFPTHPTSSQQAEGVVSGRLVMQNDCLFISSPNLAKEYLALWPVSYRLSDDGASVQDGNGDVVARLDDSVKFGGGEITTEDAAVKFVGQPIPKACSAGGYWIVTEPISS